MPAEVPQFICPLCGMHAPLERLDAPEPYPFRPMLKILGGKVAMTPEEKEEYYKTPGGRGRAPGKLQYVDITDPEAVAAAMELLQERVRQLEERYL